MKLLITVTCMLIIVTLHIKNSKGHVSLKPTYALKTFCGESQICFDIITATKSWKFDIKEGSLQIIDMVK